MMPCTRPAIPAAMARALIWTQRYQERRKADPGAEFSWPQVDNIPLNQHILPILMTMTAEHCAYCDGFPLDVTGYPTIDHFRPKSQFPERAYAWMNLFPACHFCQGHDGKQESWEDGALKPDERSYSFDRYFFFDRSNGHIKPSPAASQEEQARAQKTIDWLGLNRGGRPKARLREFRRLSYDTNNLAEQPFRFILQP